MRDWRQHLRDVRLKEEAQRMVRRKLAQDAARGAKSATSKRELMRRYLKALRDR
jgi:hypothetical protein